MTFSLFSGMLAAFAVLSGGKPQADIVVPSKPNAVERLAAEELAYHLGKMGGCEFKTISEDALASSSAKGHFFVGATRAAKSAGLDGAARRVAFLRKGLEDARLTRVAVARHVAWAADRTDERRAAFDAAFRELLDYRALIEADDVANYDCFARAESAGLGWKFNYGK